jgi:lipoprotein-anchoring transpeptidase ErfK/SrfK
MFPANSCSQASIGGRLLARRGPGVPLALMVTGLILGATSPAASASAPAVSATSIVAQANGRLVAIYPSLHAARPSRRLANPTRDGGPLVFLVKSRTPGWEQVRLPVRPNGSTGWVRDGAVTLALDPYRVQVSIGKHLITVWKGNRKIDEEPAGLGRTVLPTPRGTFYITELLKQPDPSGLYGPYAFGLSAYSDVLFNFGGGRGEIGLHGTNDPAALGTDVSHGCIRISNSAIDKLAKLLPLGTPVQITA